MDTYGSVVTTRVYFHVGTDAGIRAFLTVVDVCAVMAFGPRRSMGRSYKSFRAHANYARNSTIKFMSGMFCCKLSKHVYMNVDPSWDLIVFKS